MAGLFVGGVGEWITIRIVRFGICCSPDQAVRFAGSGFDYVELPAVTLAQDPQAFAGLPVPVTNVFFPGSIKLYGEDREAYLAHARTVIPRAAEAGVRIMVLGSGASRKAPEGMDISVAESAFIDVAVELNEVARAHGVRIAPESLGREETNVGNDLGNLARSLRDRGLGYTADAYHVLREWRASDSSSAAPSAEMWRDQLPFAPTHVHFASERARTLEPGDPHLTGFFQRLREVGYDGRVSFEGDTAGMAPGEILREARRLAEG